MTKSIVAERLNNISEDELASAQLKLYQLCNQYKLKDWKVDAGQADWRELCYREIFGFPPPIKKQKMRGRKAVWTEDISNQVVGYMEDLEVLDMLPDLDSKGKEVYQKTRLDKKYDIILKKIELKGFETADSGKKFSAKERLAVFWKNRGRKRLKLLEQQRIEIQQNEDYTDVPEEYYRDFYKNHPPKTHRLNEKVTK